MNKQTYQTRQCAIEAVPHTRLQAFDELTLKQRNAGAVLTALRAATEAEELAPEVLAGCLATVQDLIEQAQAAARRLT